MVKFFLIKTIICCIWQKENKNRVEYTILKLIKSYYGMIFRGRLVGGFPPSPALILLSIIKAPKRIRKKKKKKKPCTYSQQQKKKTSKGNMESNTNPTIANCYLPVYLSPILSSCPSPHLSLAGCICLPLCTPPYVHHLIIFFFFGFSYQYIVCVILIIVCSFSS